MNLDILSLRNKSAFVVSVLISLWHIYANTYSLLPDEWISAIHFSSLAFLCALMPSSGWIQKWFSKKNSDRLHFIFDLFLGFSAVAITIYLILFTDSLYFREVKFNAWDWFFSALALILAAEFARRTTGWLIPILTAIAIAYVVWWGRYIDGVFNFPGLSLENALFRVYFSESGMFGNIAKISWSYVFMFILLGAFLNKSGASRFILDLSIAIAGRFVGGSGFVAVIASSFMGSISGSAIANVASTGVVTIPMMKKSGFSSAFAGGVEASASTGGQIMPPVMGAGAFLMASYTQVSYLNIIAVSVLPALLYFLSIGFFVRVNAKKHNLQTIDPKTLPTLKSVLKSGWYFLIPFVLLIGLLVFGYTPTYAAGYTVISVIACSYFSSTPMKVKDVLIALSNGAKGAIAISMLLIVIGAMVVAVNTTGIGNIFSLMVGEWSGSSLFFALILIALASLILGMGLPVTASYTVLATLCAPLIYGMLAEQSVFQLMVSGGLNESASSILKLLNPGIDFSQALNYEQAKEALKPFLKFENINTRQLLFENALAPNAVETMLIISHLIIFWLSQDSNVTPPVCLAAYTAATIAKASSSKTGFYAWKIAKGLYIISFLMAYTPLIGDNFYLSLYTFFILLFGLYASVVLFEKYSEGPISWSEYLGFLFITIALLIPHSAWFSGSLELLVPDQFLLSGMIWPVHIIAILLLISMVWRKVKLNKVKFA